MSITDKLNIIIETTQYQFYKRIVNYTNDLNKVSKIAHYFNNKSKNDSDMWAKEFNSIMNKYDSMLDCNLEIIKDKINKDKIN